MATTPNPTDNPSETSGPEPEIWLSSADLCVTRTEEDLEMKIIPVLRQCCQVDMVSKLYRQ